MSGLPKGWVSTTIGATTSAVEQRPPSEGGVFKYVDIASIDRQTKKIVEPQILHSKDAPSRARKVIKANDVLVSMTRPNLNAVAMVGNDLHGEIASTGFDVLRVNEIDARWLFNIVRSPEFVEAMSSLVQGALYPAIKTDDIRSYEIPLAPNPEQKRIADKLDTVLTRVDACRERLNRVPLIIKRFRQSVLAAAISGRLTEEWRQMNNVDILSKADHNQASKFLTVYRQEKLFNIADSRLGKMLDKSKNTGILRSYIGNINVRWFSFDLENLQEIRIEDKEIANLTLRRGDVLICEGGEPGRCAIWNRDDTEIVFQKALHRVRTRPDILLPQWLVYCIKFFAESGELNDLFTGSTIKHLTGASLSQFECPLPSLLEQHEIVRRIDALFAFADRLEARLASASAAADRLTPALLAKAFRGELVPQDPNDEPASVLLQRLAQANVSKEKKPASKAKRGAKASQTATGVAGA